ncbi:MAG: type II secretion system F family protein [Candidatus Doudnabacteria bacterium]|nr:type II secretion system F family protein [Candidatus Doudnabacteria bacterium]
MPKFTYTAIQADGTRTSGSVVAMSALAAGHDLKQQGLTPVELKEQHEGGMGSLDFFQGLRGVPLSEKLTFVENLELMLKSGIPVARSMQILSKQTHNGRFAKILLNLEQQVQNGQQLNEAMAAYPNVFSGIFVSMIKVGEMSGNLEISLKQLSIQLERESDLRSRVRGAMIYPSVIVVAMLIIAVVMATFVLPKLTSVFKEMGGELPFATRIVVGVSDFMSGHIVLVFVGMVALAGAVMAGLRSRMGKEMIFRLSVYTPGISPLVVKINLARFTRVLSSLLKSGIPIVEALHVAAESIPNTLYKEVLAAAAERVKVGKVLTEVLASHERLFPFLVVQMLQVGEETGNLEEILEQIATHFEAQVDATLKNMSSIIEPILLLIIGGVVGALAYALIIPIYNIGNNIQ